MIGKTLSHYRIQEKRGSGGMGEVYRAFDTRLQRAVAIKRLLPELSSDEEYRRRFLREAQHAAGLTHQCIAAIHDILEEDGELYLVMEFVEGCTILDCNLSRERMDEFLSVAWQSVDALVTAHEHGVIHRDLKPSNIMITPDKKVKLLDFGLARRVRNPADGSTTTDVSTDSGKIRGTPAYMAPEVLLGKPPDQRSDVFSLGVVFFQVLAGRHPFGDVGTATPAAITHRILSEPAPSMARFNPWVPEDLERILNRMLDKDPDARYAGSMDLRADLRRFLREHSNSVFSDPDPKPTPKKLRIGALAGICLAVVLFAALAFHYREDFLVRLRLLSLPENPTVAVLPLVCDRENHALFSLCGGLTEQWTQRLSRLAAAHPVNIVPQSLLRSRSVTGIDEMGRQVGANVALSAAVEESGGNLRLEVLVREGGTGRVLRRGTLTGTLGDPMTLDLQLAAKGWELLGMEPSPRETRELADYGTADSLAYTRYLQALGHLGCCTEKGHEQEAIRSLEEAATLDPSFAQARAALGWAWLHLSEENNDPVGLAKASDYCLEAAKLKPSLGDAQLCLGAVFRARGDLAEALAALERARYLDPSNLALLEQLGNLYLDRGRTGDAERLYRLAIQQKPEYWRGYSIVGAFYFAQSRLVEAEEAFRKTTELAPEYYRAFTSLCAVYGELYRWEDSQRACERSLEIEEEGGAYTNLATAYFHRGMYAQSVVAAKRAIQYLDRRESTSYLEYGNLADILYWAPGEREAAAMFFQKALDIAEAHLASVPGNLGPTSARIALYLAMLGRREDSLGYLDRALKVSGDSPETVFKAAQVHGQFGDRKRTLELLRTALEKGIDKRKVLLDPRFRSMTGDPEFEKLFVNH